ncbi:hypothetical protein [Nonomuraea lactucae]|uniref:hypothetical protein n=1 Tax=Nonomuraea lactucae TaxID=2249762 RepID=UPI0013B461E2|nr:hypothetical protein [Nonomuraea lactucae]
MTILQYVGAVLIVLGVGEFLLFRYLAPSRENIARRIKLLYANAGLNVGVGMLLIAIGG